MLSLLLLLHTMVTASPGAADGTWLSGRVTDEVPGHPLNARVVAKGDGGRQEARTAADGTFRLGPVPDGTLEIWAEAEGRVCAHLIRPPMGESDLTLRLVLPGHLAGVVSRNGKPIADAEVSLRMGGYGEALLTRSDAQGRYRFDRLLPGERFTLRARHEDDWAEVRQQPASRTETPVDLPLLPGRRVEGTVMGPKGPLEGARVVVWNGDYDTVLQGETSTDARGHFVLRGIPPHARSLGASREGFTAPNRVYLTEDPLDVRLEPAPAAPAPVTTLPGGVITGVVLDERGQPVPHARMTGGFADANGRFRMTGLAFGTHPLWAARAGDVLGATPVPVQISQRHPQASVALHLRGGGTIAGYVMGPHGFPVGDANVTLTPTLQGSAAPVVSLRTNSMGRFEARSLPPGDRTVRVTWRGHDEVLDRVEASPGGPDVYLLIELRGWATGRVVCPDGTPLPSFQVNEHRFEDAQGRFTYRLPEEGDLRVIAPGFDPLRVPLPRDRYPDVELGALRLPLPAGGAGNRSACAGAAPPR